MKRIIPVLLSAVLLCGCGAASTPASSDSAPSKTPSETAAEPVNDTVIAPAEDPRAHMEPYECLEIAFLGLSDKEHTVKDVIETASGFPGFSFLRSLTDIPVIEGDLGDEANNVYFILPAETTDLRIGRYNWYAGEITDDFYSQENSGPVIFAENANAVSPLSQIEYLRHTGDGTIDDKIFTGFSVADGKLRTAYHMGTVDTTDYSKFTNIEVPFYQQSLFDRLNELDQVKEEIKAGGSLSIMDELYYDGTMYAVFDMQKADGSHWGYAITPDRTASVPIMDSPDYKDWSPIGMG